ncbi:H-NS family nucleoid-associated regulatory protein [Burkholderia pseudomallei]|uniref:H-NS family nucleoid-associated regulatory protein n=1 Tax=Burkholderia pseudomallei TaxID=28450 RepID=UPI0005DEEFE7|nr:H-NS family nucleoid-associated regulatory protein [Burkholderia pseudomallei]CAJ3337372.1 histone family protein nucleoid-structuring protein H-NS [Burkholderia pseudomallei]CAJ3927829.1 histone family protein nucleoid-structuring protein H-NS [Burkholderia pseudomallei]CAJ3979335.1 histone family protein nucleoid-structuring protein H-NS [Burkholderia pseudomallei]CAJ5704246.1 histone family protein nucleoid-structuring protein H-NS [Burkholderia pseudomallei]CAJ7178640.1 histone family p
MPTLEAIQAKIQRLQEQAEAMKAKQASVVLGRIVELMSKNGISVADIEAYFGSKNGGVRRGKSTTTQAASVAAKYQDPKSGATWSGRGRAPAWIASAKNRDRFLVDANAATTSTSGGGIANRKGNYVRGEQPAKYRDPKTGATWSGRGRAPAWMANAKDRSKFSIAADEKAGASVTTTLSKAKSKASTHVRKGPPKGKQPAKYLNPETGATWSGRGPAPAWLVAAADRSKFLIDAVALEAPTS